MPMTTNIDTQVFFIVPPETTTVFSEAQTWAVETVVLMFLRATRAINQFLIVCSSSF